MTLPAGTRLGPYEILSPLGAGGMGEVYRARDTRLGREVAVKVLPGGVAADPDRLKRFEKEARSASALNHPAIVTIHDTGETGGVAYIAMELVAGQTLRELLAEAEGPLPVRRALHIGAQVAEGLARAHEAGIVHRDLKPENVMVTPDGFAKILDFGLAKLAESDGPGQATQAPTHTSGGTHPGVVMGTVGYMSPEQALGKAVDYRSDQFSFGSMLYEMAAGRRAFARESAPETLSAIIREDPEPIGSLAPLTPAPLRWIVDRCLTKNPAERYASTRDLARDLSGLRDRLSEAGASAPTTIGAGTRPRRPGTIVPWAIAGAALAAALAAFLMRRPAPPPPGEVVRFAMPPPTGLEFISTFESTALAVSPDGSRIAFLAGERSRTEPTSATTRGASSGIWIRDISSLEARRIPETDDARSIFWSPDGRSMGFFTRDQLKRIALSGGAPVPICELPAGGGRSGTWGADGQILFVNIQEANVWRVPSAGGTPVRLIEGDASRGEVRIFWPWYLPDGKRFLYMAKLGEGGSNLMFSEPGRAPRVLMPLSSRAQYAEPGYLVFVRDGILLAQRFDWRTGHLSGDPFSLASHVSYFMTTGFAAFAVSSSGTLVYQPHRDVNRIAAFDRTGRELSTVSPSAFASVSLSSDGTKLFFDRAEPQIGTLDVWSADLSRGVETRVTSSPRVEFAPLLLPDGSLVYSAARETQPQLCLRKPGSEVEELLAPSRGGFQIPQAVSPDGRFLVYTERTSTTPFDVWVLPLSPPGKPTPLLRSPAGKGDVQFSPDGRFLLLSSDESGRSELYVMPFPGPGERSRVSTGGGQAGRWSGDEVLYLSPDGRMMSATVRTAPSLQIGAPRELFRPAGRNWISFVPTRDGKGFLAVVPDVVADEQPLTVVLNWGAGSAPK